MKNIDQWKPTKFVFRGGKLMASRDQKEMHVASRLIGDAVARLYDEQIPLHCRGRLADLGCGKVPFYEAYKAHVDDVTCMDWPGSLHGGRFLDIEHDLNLPLPVATEEFDTIILSDVLEHIPEPQNLCNEMWRILKPGGKCLMNVPFFYWIHEAPFDFHRYTRFALQRLMENAGFTILMLEPVGGSPEVIGDLTSKHFSQIPIIGGIAASVSQSLVKMLVSTNVGRRFSRSSAAVYPLGYFVVAQKSHLSLSSQKSE